MASYMGLKEGWVDADGNVEPIEFKGNFQPRALRYIPIRSVTNSS